MEEILKIFELREEKWDECPQMHTNFECSLTNAGIWDRDGALSYMVQGNYLKGQGKWIFLMKPKGTITAPTYADIRNINSGVLEAEWRNDKVVQNGISRPPQYHKNMERMERMLKEIFEENDTRFAEGELEDLMNSEGDK